MSDFLKKATKIAINFFGGNYRIEKSTTPVFRENPDTKEIRKVESQYGFMKEEKEPFLIGRWGTVEAELLRHYMGLISKYEKRYNKYVSSTMHTCAGFFSSGDKKYMHNYGEIYKKATEEADLMKTIGIIPKEIKMISYIDEKKKIISSKKVRPWFQKKPWTRYLKDRKVLVVSPFKKDIVDQYKKRDKLFENGRVLPDFSLEAVKAVNTRGKKDVSFSSWFEALEYQKEMISSVDFDIALLGCGAYGMPLCDYIKTELNRSAIYMGGGLQLLFGLRGARWDGQDQYEELFNEHWKYPDENVHDPEELESKDAYGRRS
jgi:hypothetical protein